MQIKQLLSASNPFFKHVKKLLSQKKYRAQEKLFVVEGERILNDALKSGVRPVAIVLSQTEILKNAEKYASVCPLLYSLPDPLMHTLSDTSSPQGVLGIFRMPELSAMPYGDKFLFLNALQDPGNIGTIIRTAEAFGLDGIFYSDDCPDLFSPKLLRATMGGIFRIPVMQIHDPIQFIARLKQLGVVTYAAAMEENAQLLGQFRFEKRSCIIIGNEGNGLSQSFIHTCDTCIMIPMQGQAQSLNAAMAAGICCWEMTKGNIKLKDRNLGGIHDE